MSRIILVTLTVVVAVIGIAVIAWQRAGDRHAAATIISPSASFKAVNPEREFVADIARPLLATPLFKSAIVDNPPADAPHLQTQCDIVILLTAAQEIAPDAMFNESLKAAAANLLSRYRTPMAADWRNHALGSPGAEPASPLTRAHVMLALVGAYKVMGDQSLLEAAIATWQNISDVVMTVPRLTESDQRELLLDAGAPYDSQTLIAALEAMVALHDASPDAALWRDIEIAARFIAKELMARGNGLIARRYTAALAPINLTDGDTFSADQFVFAYALGRAADAGLSPLFLGPAGDAIDRTLAIAVAADGAVAPSFDGLRGTVTTPAPSARATAEALRAITHYAYLRGRERLWPRFAPLYRSLRTQLGNGADTEALASTALFFREIARLRTLRD